MMIMICFLTQQKSIQDGKNRQKEIQDTYDVMVPKEGITHFYSEQTFSLSLFSVIDAGGGTDT